MTLKQFFCFHKSNCGRDMGFCVFCKRVFSRKDGWKLCGLDLIKIRLARLFCFHKCLSGIVGKYCIKCGKSNFGVREFDE